jgi:hypothetical protein
LPSAILTNSFTNALHACFLLIYFILVSKQYKLGKIKSILVVFLFFIFFVEKVLGAIAHYFLFSLSPAAIMSIWIVISFNAVLLTYFLLYSLDIPNVWRRSALVACAILNLIFCVDTYFGSSHYGLLALSGVITFSTAIFFTHRLTRLGFICIICANVFWIIARLVISTFFIDIERGNEWYRYDNDVYHIFLIISTYIVYLSLVREDWTYPKKTTFL